MSKRKLKSHAARRVTEHQRSNQQKTLAHSAAVIAENTKLRLQVEDLHARLRQYVDNIEQVRCV